MKAWNHQNSFQEGTNIKAWLFTILRNEYFSQLRKRRREVEDADGDYAGSVVTPGGQESQLDMADLRIALQQLPDDQREAVVLVGASGFSYQEVAEICHVPVGTVKSRVNRARTSWPCSLAAARPRATVRPEKPRGGVLRASRRKTLRNTSEPTGVLRHLRTEESSMTLGTILIIILILILIGALPSWGYSRGWGYGPSGILGLVLIVVVILILMGRI
jgi:transposase